MKILAILVVFAINQANTDSHFINSDDIQNVTSKIKSETSNGGLSSDDAPNTDPALKAETSTLGFA